MKTKINQEGQQSILFEFVGNIIVDLCLYIGIQQLGDYIMGYGVLACIGEKFPSRAICHVRACIHNGWAGMT